MTYQPKIYRKQGAAEFVVASSGTITIESGGKLDIQSGSTFTLAGTVALTGSMTASSAGSITVSSSAYAAFPYQSLGSSQTATPIRQTGCTLLTGTTTGPTYILGAPSAAGIPKWVILNPSSSGATHRCVVSTSAWTGKVTHHSATGDKLTLDTSSQGGALLISSGTSEWRVVNAFAIKEPSIA